MFRAEHIIIHPNAILFFAESGKRYSQPMPEFVCQLQQAWRQAWESIESQTLHCGHVSIMKSLYRATNEKKTPYL